MASSYDDLTQLPMAAFKTPVASWDLRITPQIEGTVFAQSRWTRLDGFLPALVNTYEEPRAQVRLEVIGGVTAAILRVVVTNRDTKPHALRLRCDSANWGENPAWIDPVRWPGDNLVAGWNERADRVLVLGIGAETYSLQGDGRAPGPRRWSWSGTSNRANRAPAGSCDPTERTRPICPGCAAQLVPGVETAKQEWHALLDRAAQFQVPDPGVATGYSATRGPRVSDGELTVGVEEPQFRQCAAVTLHVRLPGGLRLRSVNPESGARVSRDGESLQWKTLHGTHQFTAMVGG